MIGLRRHDRYVLKAFWAAFGAVLFFFTLITIIAHLADRANRITRRWDDVQSAGYEPMSIVAKYYATMIPFIWHFVVPLSAVLAASFSLSRLTRHNEISPLVTAGVSTRRVVLPIVLSGVGLAGLLFGMQELLGPLLSREHLAASELLNRAEPDRISEVAHFQDAGGARLSVAAFMPLARQLEGAMLTYRTPEGRPMRLEWYPILTWDPEVRGWYADHGGTLFPLAAADGGVLRKPVAPGTRVGLEASDKLLEVTYLKDKALGLSSSETGALVDADPDNPRLVMRHQRQFTGCVSVAVLLLLCVPYALRLGRRSAIPGAFAAIVGSACWYGAAFFTAGLAGTGEINPIFLAWVPTVTFLGVGLALYLTMET